MLLRFDAGPASLPIRQAEGPSVAETYILGCEVTFLFASGGSTWSMAAGAQAQRRRAPAPFLRGACAPEGPHPSLRIAGFQGCAAEVLSGQWGVLLLP